MPTLFECLDFKSNPFEHYTAETEPHIAEYAVRPPYLQTTRARALGLTTLFFSGTAALGRAPRESLYLMNSGPTPPTAAARWC